jgi:hypothetical protein
MDTYFEETFDRNLSGYHRLYGPYNQPEYTQQLNTDSPEFEYFEPRNMLDRKNQFDVKSLFNRNILKQNRNNKMPQLLSSQRLYNTDN